MRQEGDSYNKGSVVMYMFNCAKCKNIIRTDYANIGDPVECPLCGFIQIAPEPLLGSGKFYEDFRLLSSFSQGMLWNSYIAENAKNRGSSAKFVLRIPTQFFLKRVSDCALFAEHVIRAGTTGIEGLEQLSDRCTNSGKEFFAYNYNPDLRSLASICASGTAFSEMDALLIIKKISEALSNAWEKDSLIHGAISPSNVAIKLSSLEPMLSGVGISEFLASEKKLLDSGFSIWDQRYVAPEFILNGKFDSPSIDICSLGRIFYTLLMAENAPPQFDENGAFVEDSSVMLKNVSEHKPKTSEMGLMLLSSLCEANPDKRPSSYSALSIKIEGVLESISPEYRAIKYRKKINIWGRYDSKVKKEACLPPLSSGMEMGLGQKKTFHIAPLPKKDLTFKNKAGRVFSSKNIRTLNHRWPSKESSSGAGLLILGLLVIFALVFAYNYLRDSSQKAKRESNKTAQEALSADAQKSLRQDEETREPQGKPPEKDSVAARKDEAKDPQVSPKKLKFEEELAVVAEFVSRNPESYDEAIEKYEALKRPFVTAGKFDDIGRINDLIFELEKKKQRKVEETVQSLIEQIKPLIDKGENNQAVLFLDSYSGKFAAETKRQRKDISRKILEGVSVAEISRGEAIRIVDAVFEKNANLVASGKVTELSDELRVELENPAVKPVLDILKAYVSDLAEFAALKTAIREKAKTPKSVSDEMAKIAPDEKSFLKGLAYSEIGDFQKAYENFDKMQFGSGNYFTTAFYEIEADKEAQKIIQKYSLEFERGKPETLVSSLYKSQMSPDKAKDLLEDVKTFESNYSDSEFYVKNSGQIEAIKKHCFNLLKTPEKERERELVVLGDQEGTVSSGAQLLSMLEKADNWTTIRLKKGVYSFSSPEDRARRNKEDKNRYDLEQSSLSSYSFNLSLTGLKLIGEEGVIFDNDLTITAQSVEISNIVVRRGAFMIMPHSLSVLPDSGNVMVRNCVFEDEETRVRNGINITFENCFSKGMIIERSKNVVLRHCTIVAQQRGLSQNAALWIDGDGVNIFQSVIYGSYLGIIFSDKGKDIKKDSEIRSDRGIVIDETLLFGERGICAFQFGDRPLEEKDFVTSASKVSKYCRPKRNIYYSPEFTDPVSGNWRLVKGTPGYKGGAPKYKGGPIYYRNLKLGKDLGVLWDEINIVPKESKDKSHKRINESR